MYIYTHIYNNIIISHCGRTFKESHHGGGAYTYNIIIMVYYKRNNDDYFLRPCYNISLCVYIYIIIYVIMLYRNTRLYSEKRYAIRMRNQMPPPSRIDGERIIIIII